MSALRLDRVSKHWGTSKAVDEASFATASGRLVVLLGPSGCGKSTTLRMIAGLDAPTTGRVWIGERDVTDLGPAQRRISMVFQSYALFPHLNVRENILFGVKVRGEPAAEHGRRLARVADLLGLTPLLDRKPSQLSGGQQQRVALGRAIIAETLVCLIDEPLSNLDAQLRQEMQHKIRALQQKLGITMVYVTHDQTEAMSMADQVVLLNAGRIEQDAAPADQSSPTDVPAASSRRPATFAAIVPAPKVQLTIVSAPRYSALCTTARTLPGSARRTCSGRMPTRKASSPPAASTFIGGVPMKRAAKIVAGRAYRSAGAASCSIRPAFSSTTWSAMLIASVWSWVT